VAAGRRPAALAERVHWPRNMANGGRLTNDSTSAWWVVLTLVVLLLLLALVIYVS